MHKSGSAPFLLEDMAGKQLLLEPKFPGEQTTGWAGMVESKALWFIWGWGQVDRSLG